MKQFFTCLILFGLLGLNAQEDAISRHFSEYQSNDDFTTVFIGKRMFEMLSNSDIDINEVDGKEVAEIIRDLVGLRILTTDKAPAGFYREAKNRLSANRFEELMTVKDGNQDIHFFILEGEKGIQELVLMTNENTEVVLMSFLGNLDLNKISKLSKTLDIDGAEHLEKLKERQ